MSWQLASFLVLGAVLVGGFAWYERARPPSQIVALVAALAALAVAGRVALAPIPNVVATTDVALFSGFAIGAGPGFVVGALAGVVSNFWLGQGPWTPWQMAGWGMAGILGAALCAVTRGRAGRLTLAAACGFAGLAYGVLLNFSIMPSYGGELSWERFWALQVRAVPFDAAHAIGNVALALVAGPAMVRMLVRFRERFEWKRGSGERPAQPGWSPGLRGGSVAALLLAVLLLMPASARAADADAAARWLASVQNRDGGFGSTPGRESSVSMTGWAMLGLEASGRNPLDVKRAGATPIGFLARNAAEINSTGDLARTTLAMVGAGVEPRDFAGRNLLAELRGRMRRNGSFEGWPNDTAFGILALRAGGSPAGLRESLSWLRKVQNDDGGWGVVPGAPSDADSTGAVLQVVRGDRVLSRGLRYLRRAQLRGGGFTVGGSGAINSQSTAWALQGMIAAGLAPASIREAGASGLDYLTARQAPDGHIRYSRSSDQTPIWVTGQALVAVAGKSFPIAAVARKPPPAGNAADRSGEKGPAAGEGLGSTASESGAEKGASAAPGAKAETSGSGAAAATAGEANAKATPDPRGRLAVAPVPLPDDRDDSSSPLAPVGIGLGSALSALGVTWWLGRRRSW